MRLYLPLLLCCVAVATASTNITNGNGAGNGNGKGNGSEVLSKPHFEVLRMKPAAVTVGSNVGNKSVTLGHGIAVAMGDSVKLVCLLTESSTNRVIVISKRHPKVAVATGIGNQTQQTKDNYKILIDRSFASDFATLRSDQSQLRRYDALYGTARMSNNIYYNFSSLNIRNLQPEDVGDYVCNVFSASASSPPTEISIIMINAIYAVSFVNQPTRRFELTRNSINTQQIFQIAVDRHVAHDVIALVVRLCPTDSLDSLTKTNTGTGCYNASELCKLRLLSSEQQQVVSSWSEYWAAKRIRDLWECSLNVTSDLSNYSLVAQAADHVTLKQLSDNVSFVLIPEPEPTQIQEITTELLCEPASHEAFGFHGQVVTFACRVAPVTQTHAFFWAVFTDIKGGPAYSCWDSNECLMPQSVVVQEHEIDLKAGEARMRLDVIVDIGTTVLWQYRAGVMVDGATFYSKPFSILLVDKDATSPVSISPEQVTAEPNFDLEPTVTGTGDGKIEPSESSAIDTESSLNVTKPVQANWTTTLKPIELADKVSGLKTPKPKKPKPSKAPIIRKKSVASLLRSSALSVALALVILIVDIFSN